MSSRAIKVEQGCIVRLIHEDFGEYFFLITQIFVGLQEISLGSAEDEPCIQTVKTSKEHGDNYLLASMLKPFFHLIDLRSSTLELLSSAEAVPPRFTF